MKRLLISTLSVVLCVLILLPLVSCSAVKNYLESGADEEKQTTQKQDTNKLPEKTGYQRTNLKYSFLIITEGEEVGTLGSIAYAVLDSTKPSLEVLQIPQNLFVNNSNGTVAKTYKELYQNAQSLGRSKAIENTCHEMMAILKTGAMLECDYYLFFDKDAIVSFTNLVGGIEVFLPFYMQFSQSSAIAGGKQKLNGSFAWNVLNYYNYAAGSELEAAKLVWSGILLSLKNTLSPEKISLFTIELRKNLYTDVPESNGVDIFFLRKLYNCPSDAIRFASIDFTAITNDNEEISILNKPATIERINSYFELYETKISAEDFDPEYVFYDISSGVIFNAYNANINNSQVFAAKDIVLGILPISQKTETP